MKKRYDKEKTKGEFSTEKRLYRIEEGKKVAGVCGGLAEYFHIDPTIIRLAWALVGLCGGTGIVAYIVAALVMPVKNEVV